VVEKKRGHPASCRRDCMDAQNAHFYAGLCRRISPPPCWATGRCTSARPWENRPFPTRSRHQPNGAFGDNRVRRVGAPGLQGATCGGHGRMFPRCRRFKTFWHFVARMLRCGLDRFRNRVRPALIAGRRRR
jgi:hypothetical protein